MAQKALAAVKNFMSKIPFKAPWEASPLKVMQMLAIVSVAQHELTLQATGVASSAEFRDYLPQATEYRIHSPG